MSSSQGNPALETDDKLCDSGEPLTRSEAIMPLFREAKQSRIFQDVVEQIEDAILDGDLKAGDRLPPERELKETLKTSRSTLREALRVLEQKGLIEMRLGMGGGAIVKAVSTKQVSQSLGLLIRSRKVSLEHLAEFRERFEGDIAALAASRAFDPDRAHLQALLEKARRFAEGGDDQGESFIAVDKEIHLYFARMTKNPIYITILKTVHQNIDQYFRKYLLMATREMKQNLADLYDLVGAIEKGDQEGARSLAQAHVRRFSANMERSRRQAEAIAPKGRH
ncbi:MAG: FadR/GntR family transcriptional regulator [Desulfosarcinaceae bacterium]|jgi:DNA-binding FadR family transcriptional regulator